MSREKAKDMYKNQTIITTKLYENEIKELLEDCSEFELHVIVSLIKSVKDSLRKEFERKWNPQENDIRSNQVSDV